VPLYTHEHKIDSKRIYEGEIINFRVDRLKLNGKEVLREVIEHNGGVVILCQPTPQEVVLIKQYRYSVDEVLWEFPAGRIEKGEDPLPAAKRELTEETGYVATEWVELSRFYTAPGFCNEMLYMYKATNVTLDKKSLDEDEETDVIVMKLTEAWQLVTSGAARDAKTVAGLGLLYAPTLQK
jgi:ADP-ribose pyrophosphatase